MELIITEQMKPHLREITNGVLDRPIPPGWDCYAVLHESADRFYSGVTAYPIELEAVIRSKKGYRYKALGVALRRLLDIDNNYRVFVFSRTTRPTVEQFFERNHFPRVATRMGEGVKPDRILYKVVSTLTGMTRYVSGTEEMSKELLIEKANEGFIHWLNIGSQKDYALRRTINSAVKSTLKASGVVFEPSSVVTPTNRFKEVPVRTYRSICMEANTEALKQFVRETMC